MIRRALFALVWCVSLACTAGVRAPLVASHDIDTKPKTAAPQIATHWQLPFAAAREILQGAPNTLFFLEAIPGGVKVSELDTGTLGVVRSASIPEPGTFLTWARSSRRIYILFTRSDTDTHRLVAIDPSTLSVVADSVTAVAPQTGARGDPTLEPGRRGVRIVFLEGCPQDPEGLCYVYETHALDTLSVIKVRKHMLEVPADQGDDDTLRPNETSSWTYDSDAHTLVSRDGKSVACPIHGTRIGNAIWVGRRMFVATSGCCGGPRGGFYVCEVPEP